LVDGSFRQAEPMRRRHRRVPPPRSGFAGFRFPREVIVLAVRWYLRYGLSYRDVEELLAERGIEVDHVTVYRWGRVAPARCHAGAVSEPVMLIFT
jgi:transposase-like protein